MDSEARPTARRRKREHDTRQQMILGAAKAVFAERGFFNATVEEIAGRAELAVGTLYRYFKSKEEMYVSLLFEAMTIFHDRIGAIRASGRSPDAQLRAVWDFFSEFYTEKPEYYRALMFLHNERLPGVISPEVMTAINHRSGQNFRLVAEIVQAGVDAGIYCAVDTLAVVDVMWSLLMGIAQLVDTRRNLGVTTGRSLETLHREGFGWIEGGLRRHDGPCEQAIETTSILRIER